ncbi:hypothetical protein C0J52_22091 [Blattella germanica]|nr:hypothetical protein C0J52_22091 [Blattella germanica]
MFSTICFHVVIENGIRPVKIILYYFNRCPPGRNGLLRTSPVYGYKAIRKKHKRHQTRKENFYAKWRQKPNRGRQLKPQRTLNACIAKGFTRRRTKVGFRVPMGRQ